MKALWAAADGTKFVIEGDTVEEIRNTIDELRKQLGFDTPDIEHIHATNKDTEQEVRQIQGAVGAEEDPKLAQYLQAHLEATLKAPDDPSKMN